MTKTSKHKIGKKIAVATAAAFLLAPVSLSYTQSGRMTADHRIEITISDPSAHAATVKHYGVDWSFQSTHSVTECDRKILWFKPKIQLFYAILRLKTTNHTSQMSPNET